MCDANVSMMRIYKRRRNHWGPIVLPKWKLGRPWIDAWKNMYDIIVKGQSYGISIRITVQRPMD